MSQILKLEPVEIEDEEAVTEEVTKLAAAEATLAANISNTMHGLHSLKVT